MVYGSGTRLMCLCLFYRELYIDGNNLECEGAMELIKLCVEQAELEALLRAEELKRKQEEEEAIKTAGKDSNYNILE